MSDDEDQLIALRKKVQSVLAALTPREARVLRARYGKITDSTVDDEEEQLRALVQELARLQKKKQ